MLGPLMEPFYIDEFHLLSSIIDHTLIHLQSHTTTSTLHHPLCTGTLQLDKTPTTLWVFQSPNVGFVRATGLVSLAFKMNDKAVEISKTYEKSESVKQDFGCNLLLQVEQSDLLHQVIASLTMMLTMKMMRRLMEVPKAHNLDRGKVYDRVGDSWDRFAIAADEDEDDDEAWRRDPSMFVYDLPE
ncbi:hypothetical protein N7453_004421 [Penicillium expansum]|nr:hypothetical protein N7453_004421 [Penicillium expansum]